MSRETRTVINLKYIGIGLIWVAVAIAIVGIAAFAPQSLNIAGTVAICAAVATYFLS